MVIEDVELLRLRLRRDGRTRISGVKKSGAPRFNKLFEFVSACGILSFSGDVFTSIFKVVVILFVSDSALGGRPLFLLTGGTFSLPSITKHRLFIDSVSKKTPL